MLFDKIYPVKSIETPDAILPEAKGELFGSAATE
jgi:hypothetical protein